MSRTAEKVESLAHEDEDMLDILELIRERVDQNDGEVEWADVRDDLTSGQWGRIIEIGLLESGEEGFRIADREGFDEALDGEATTGVVVPELDIDEDEASWTIYDKVAAGGAAALMIGYYYDPLRDAVGLTLDLLMAPLDATLPFYAIILAVAMVTGLYSTLMQANLMNTDRISAYQDRMKAMQRKQKEAQQRKREAEEEGATEAEIKRLEDELEEIQEEQMEAMLENLGMFKEQFRPMVWIMLFVIPLFLWMWWRIHDVGLPTSDATVVFPMMGAVDWDDGIRGIRILRPWIIWYFLCSLGFTQLLRKALNIDMTPTG